MKRIIYIFFTGLLFTISSMAQPFDLTFSSPESGTVTHQARNSITFAAGYSYTPGGGTMTAEIVNPVITGDTEYSDAISPSSYAINTALAVGKTPGGFQFAGSANYTIPLELPKGTAQLQPSINLSYTSSFYDGLMGIGWNIGGISTISRANQTIYYDSAANPIKGDLTDKYVLDGKRLLVTSGTYGADNSVYGTELEEFSKIVAHGTTGQGPEYFTVYTKSGLIYEYGNTTDSKVKRDGTCILSWKLNKITDRYNNYISFGYFDSDDEHPIYLIEYTGNTSLSKSPFASIQFNYKRRSDISTYVYGGKEFTRDLLLDQIEIKNNGQLFKKYEMTYMKDNYAQLLKVTEKSSGDQPLNPTVFAWTDQTEQFSESTHYTSSVSERFFPGDFNGDGRTDVVTVPALASYSGTEKWKLYLCNTSGNMVYQTEGYLEWGFQNFITADYNSDGLTDLMLVALDGTYDFYYYQSNGSGFNANLSYWSVDNDLNSHSIVDYNGDGKLEILAHDGYDYELHTYSGTIITSGSTSFGTDANFYVGSGHYQICDFNGDGCSDILTLFSSTYKILEFKGTGSGLLVTHTDSNIANSNSLLLGDFNGDGTTDIIKTTGPVHPAWSMLCYTKDGFQEHQISGFSGFNLYLDNNRWNSCDFNGDGKMDIILWGKGQDIINTSNRINVAINKGNGYEYALTEYTSSVNFKIGLQSTNPELTWEGYENTLFFYFGDFNGDGREQFFYREPTANVSKCFSFASGTPSNLASTVIDGLGGKTSLSYLPMTNSSVYTRYAGATYPVLDYLSPMQMVSQVDTDDGIGGVITHTYTYEGAKVHLQGKGFMGFSKITDTNTDTGIAKESTYSFHSSRYFPQLASVITKYGATALSTVSNTWNELTLTNNRVFPYISPKSETDNQKNLTVSTTVAYDSYGNPTSVSKNFGGTHTQTTTYAYNDERVSSWLIGRPTTITETSVRDSQTKTFTTSRTYFTSNNLPDIDQYNSGDGSYWQLDREYDSFGNLWKEHKSTTGLSTQTTIYGYDTNDGVNLLSVTDPAGNQTSYTYYSTTGLLHTETDPLGNETIYNYNSVDQLSSIAPDVGITTTITSSLVVSGGPSNARYYIQKSGNDGFVTKEWYDRLNRELRTETEVFGGLVSKTDKQYNNKGQLYQVSEPATGTPSYWNTIYYDNYGRITSQDPYYGATTSYSYSNATSTRTVNSRNYTTTVDAAGLVTNRTDPGGSITYSYFGDGTLKSTLAPGSVTTSMTYDRNGNQLSLSDPSAGTITKTWYGTGQLKTLQNGRGQTTTYTYQANGLLDYYTASPADEGLTNYTYNTNNQVSSITSPGGTSGVSRSFTYYTNGQVNTINEAVDGVSNTVTYEYDDKGRLYRKYFNGTSEYEQYDYYSTNGYLYRIQFTADGNTSTVWQLTNMDAYQRITQTSVGGTTATKSYNSSTNMLSQIAANGVQEYNYTFHGATKTLTSRTNVLTSHYEAFGYDTNGLDRLISVTGNPSQSITYESVKKGNILTKSDAGTYAYDNTPYAVSGISGALNIDTAKQELEYYSFEKVKKITENLKTAEFVYNADHQRIRMTLKNNGTTTKTRWYFGSCCERELVGGVTTQYIWIGGDAYTALAVAKKVGTGSWTVYNIFRDHLGTITHLKTGSSTADEYSFDAWGRRRDKDDWTYTLSSEPDLFAGRGFTAHEYLADFKLYNMNGRLYDPIVGRFLSPDPHIQNPDFTQNYNRYSYCLNNPLKFNDLSGEFWWIPVVWFGNYAINWLDNTINKGMSAKEAFRQTPIAFSGNYSPSTNQFSNYQLDAFKAAKHEEKVWRDLNEFEANMSGKGQVLDDVWNWADEHFYIGAEGEITYGVQLAATLKNGLGFNLAPYHVVRAEGSLNNRDNPLSLNSDTRLKINDYGIAYYAGVNYHQAIDYSNSYHGVKTNTISIGALGVFGVTLNFNEDWKFTNGYGGIDISGKVAAGWGASGSLKIGFEY